MAKIVKARVVGIAKKDKTKLFAVGTKPKEFYFVRYKKGDSGFFGFIYGNVKNHGRKYNVELSANGRNAILVVPKQFTDIYRDGLVYIIDTNYPEDIMRPTSMVVFNKMCYEFTKEFMKINSFMSYPYATTKKESIALYRGYSNAFFTEKPFGPDMSIEEKVVFLNEIVTGKHEFLDGHGRVHLIVNPSGDIHDPVFRALSEQYGHKIQRYTVNNKAEKSLPISQTTN